MNIFMRNAKRIYRWCLWGSDHCRYITVTNGGLQLYIRFFVIFSLAIMTFYYLLLFDASYLRYFLYVAYYISTFGGTLDPSCISDIAGCSVEVPFKYPLSTMNNPMISIKFSDTNIVIISTGYLVLSLYCMVSIVYFFYIYTIFLVFIASGRSLIFLNENFGTFLMSRDRWVIITTTALIIPTLVHPKIVTSYLLESIFAIEHYDQLSGMSNLVSVDPRSIADTLAIYVFWHLLATEWSRRSTFRGAYYGQGMFGMFKGDWSDA